MHIQFFQVHSKEEIDSIRFGSQSDSRLLNSRVTVHWLTGVVGDDGAQEVVCGFGGPEAAREQTRALFEFVNLV